MRKIRKIDGIVVGQSVMRVTNTHGHKAWRQLYIFQIQISLDAQVKRLQNMWLKPCHQHWSREMLIMAPMSASSFLIQSEHSKIPCAQHLCFTGSVPKTKLLVLYILYIHIYKHLWLSSNRRVKLCEAWRIREWELLQSSTTLEKQLTVQRFPVDLEEQATESSDAIVQILWSK